MNWEVRILKHNGDRRIAVYFEKNAELISLITLIANQELKNKRTAHFPKNSKQTKKSIKNF